MPRFRFMIRWMMLAVAVAGIGLGGYRMHRHHLRSVERARSHAESVSHCRFMGSEVYAYQGFRFPGSRETPATPAELRKVVESYSRKESYHAAMRRKYERAARSLWLPVVPDTPEPE